MSTVQYDIHLSAEKISLLARAKLKELGFVMDLFSGNRNSIGPEYHASYRQHLDEPNDELWKQTVYLLKSDSSGFRGCLEEERFSDEFRYHFDTRCRRKPHKGILHPFTLDTCKRGEHKACDIHINIDLEQTTDAALAQMDRFNFISFERTVHGSNRRIYSLTFGDLALGKGVFDRLYRTFVLIPGMVGKIKLEEVTRFKVLPLGAAQLPIVRNQFASEWLNK